MSRGRSRKGQGPRYQRNVDNKDFSLFTNTLGAGYRLGINLPEPRLFHSSQPDASRRRRPRPTAAWPPRLRPGAARLVLPSLRPANLQPAAEAVEVGRLILKAAEWSPQSHELFPEAARKRAVEVMRLGYLIAWDEERFDSREGAAPELADIWRGFVLPRVVVR